MSKNYVGTSSQWSVRPVDERYFSLAEAEAVLASERRRSRDIGLFIDLLAYDSATGGLCYDGLGLEMTHWSRIQLLRLLGIPMNFLASLSSELVEQIIQERLQQFGTDGDSEEYEEKDSGSDTEHYTGDNDDVGLGFGGDNSTHCPNRRPSLQALITRCGGDSGGNGDKMLVRSLTTSSYSRVWQSDIIRRLRPYVEDGGWKVPVARDSGNGEQLRIATEADILRSNHPTLGVHVGDKVGGTVFVSDRDSHIMLIDDSQPVFSDAGGELYRAAVISNSEVGNGRALKLTMFIFRYVCGNLLLWDLQLKKSVTKRVVHKGKTRTKVSDLFGSLSVVNSQESDDDISESINFAKGHLLGDTRADVVDYVFSRKLLSRREAESSYELGILESDTTDSSLDPRSVWGFSQGITRLANSMQYGDEADRLRRVPVSLLASL